MSTLDIGRSIPSTNTNGSPPFHDVCPRITICGSSSPGWPVVLMVTTPGRLPARACPRLVTPPVRSNTLASVCVIAPTTDAFFCWPKPTTTTSSNWVSSWSVILKLRSFPTLNSRVVIPTYETTRVADSEGTFSVKLPSKSVTVPREGVPFTTTEAPIRGSELLSTTVPLTEMPPPTLRLQVERECHKH